MGDFHFYLVFIEPRPEVDAEELQAKMNLANDWFRLNRSTWLVYTNSDADKWYTRLSPFVKTTGRLFITKIDVTKRQGWMKKDFWKWIRREK